MGTAMDNSLSLFKSLCLNHPKPRAIMWKKRALLTVVFLSFVALEIKLVNFELVLGERFY
jgi:hypothetical protein